MSQHGWREVLASLREPRVLVMLALGFSAGLPNLLVFSTLNARLADVGVETATIGFFSWLGVTYSIKVLWAPVVDRVPQQSSGLGGGLGRASVSVVVPADRVGDVIGAVDQDARLTLVPAPRSPQGTDR